MSLARHYGLSILACNLHVEIRYDFVVSVVCDSYDEELYLQEQNSQ